MMEILNEITEENKQNEVDRVLSKSDECQTLLKLFRQFTSERSVRYLEGDMSGQKRIHSGTANGFKYRLTLSVYVNHDRLDPIETVSEKLCITVNDNDSQFHSVGTGSDTDE